MKYNKGFAMVALASVIAGILVVSGGVYWLKQNNINRENKIKELNSKEVFNDFTLNGNNCYDRSKYFIITRADLSGNAGDDILVKFKINKQQKIDCDYKVGEDDFEIKNSCTDGLNCYRAQHFSYIKDNLLIIDEGTGTSRSFIIYDLDKREKLFSDNYSAGLFELKENILNYWRKTNDIPNKENCSRVEEYMKMGGAKIEGKITLDISNPTDRKFEGFRCSYAE